MKCSIYLHIHIHRTNIYVSIYTCSICVKINSSSIMFIHLYVCPQLVPTAYNCIKSQYEVIFLPFHRARVLGRVLKHV